MKLSNIIIPLVLASILECGQCRFLEDEDSALIRRATPCSQSNVSGERSLDEQCFAVPATSESPSLQKGHYSSSLAGTVETDDFEPVLPPKMPKKIRAIIHQDWDYLDPKGSDMLERLSKVSAVMEFPHARDTFFTHLHGTFSLLAAWGQPEVVRRTGLMHTAYSGDLFQFYLFRSESESDREQVRDILGEEAEALTWLFGTINRGQLCNFGNVVNGTVPHTSPLTGPQTVDHRIKGTIEMSMKDTANILMVTIADYADQMVEINGWKDHHQIDHPEVLYPGDGKPAIAFHWFSTVCNTVRDYLDVIPAIFDSCTSLILYEDEVIARDAYWNVVLNESRLTEQEQIEGLYKSVTYNRFIGEPHVLLAQLYYRQKQYHAAATHASKALEKMYVLATGWDKRRSFAQWVGVSRVIILRSNRVMEGYDSLPTNPDMEPSAQGKPLISLRGMFEEMNDYEE